MTLKKTRCNEKHDANILRHTLQIVHLIFNAQIDPNSYWRLPSLSHKYIKLFLILLLMRE